MNEAAWKSAPWTSYYVDIEGDKKPLPYLQTRCKMLWDDQNLYIAAEMLEPHIWGNLTKHDQIIFHDNDFEVFIDPDNDTHHYFELEWNALNTVFDLYMSKPYRNRGKLRTDWNAKNMKSAIAIDGTINNASDTDRKWILEIAIPFDDLQLDDFITPSPKPGSTWRINFSRVQWETEVADGKYVKKKNASTGKNLPENNWVWSPQGVINMHFPERWGYIRFDDKAPGKKPISFSVPGEETLKKYLWLIYYKQKDFSHRHKKYSSTLEELGMPAMITENVKEYSIQLTQQEERKFFATITNEENGGGWSIDQDGYIQPYKTN